VTFVVLLVAATLQPSAKLVWRTLGENLADAGEPRRAESALAMALALDDRDAESWAELGRLERRLSRRPTATVFLARAAALDPRSSAHHDLAELALADGDDAVAERELRADLAVEPTCYDSRVALAALLARRGQPARAAAEYETSLGFHPEDPTALAGLGRARAALGDDERAIGAFLDALDAGDDSVQPDLDDARRRHRWRTGWPFAALPAAVAVALAAALVRVRKRRAP
jgi:tetratricopeptide (TPR) repeat protein